MNFPDTMSTQLTEAIMRAFSRFNENAVIQLETREYNKVFSHVYKTLESTGLNEKFAKDYDTINNHKSRLRKKYSKQVDSLDGLFPNGIYTKDKHGDLVGLNVMMKTVVRDLLELKGDECVCGHSAATNTAGTKLICDGDCK